MIPYLTAFSRKTDEAEWIDTIQELQCPDGKDSVVFRLERA